MPLLKVCMIDIWVDAVGRLRRSLPLWPHPEPKGRCTWEVWHCYSVRTSVLYYLKISRYPPLTPNQEILVHDNSHSVSFFILMSLKCTSSSLHDPKEKWGKRFAYSHEGKHNISRGVKMGAKGLGAPTVQGKGPFLCPGNGSMPTQFDQKILVPSRCPYLSGNSISPPVFRLQTDQI